MEISAWHIRMPGISQWFLAALMIWTAACQPVEGNKDSRRPSDRPAPVTVAEAIRKSIPLEIRAIGNVEAFSTVAVKSRITGELQSIHFEEGREVRKGDRLFTIDPRPYEAALREATARLEKDRALAVKAAEDLRRYEMLIRQQFISQEQYDQALANFHALEATVAADEAAVETARIHLGYTHIMSPINGRTGAIQVHAGNMVKANDDNQALVIIQEIQPIFVTFNVPESHLNEISRRMRAGNLLVEARLDDRGTSPETGRLTFLDNTVDAMTGTIRLKATFINNTKNLWPGRFVNVSLILGTLDDAVVVPSQAIQIGEAGTFCYVVSPNHTATYRAVEAGPSNQGETAVLSGIVPGDQVVTDGHLRLTPDAPLEIRNTESVAVHADPAKHQRTTP